MTLTTINNMLSHKTHFSLEDTHRMIVKGWEKTFQANGKTIITKGRRNSTISDKID